MVLDCRPPVPETRQVVEMPAAFTLELAPGQTVALETICKAYDLNTDIRRTENGTIVGQPWHPFLNYQLLITLRVFLTHQTVTSRAFSILCTMKRRPLTRWTLAGKDCRQWSQTLSRTSGQEDPLGGRQEYPIWCRGIHPMGCGQQHPMGCSQKHPI
jgi:hypothetical protein